MLFEYFTHAYLRLLLLTVFDDFHHFTLYSNSHISSFRRTLFGGWF